MRITVDLTDLAAGIGYHFRVVASNGTDVANGDDGRFTAVAA
jgi:hypothetical protein